MSNSVLADFESSLKNQFSSSAVWHVCHCYKKTLYFVIKDRLLKRSEVAKINEISRESIFKFQDEEENKFFGGVVFFSLSLHQLQHEFDKWCCKRISLPIVQF